MSVFVQMFVKTEKCQVCIRVSISQYLRLLTCTARATSVRHTPPPPPPVRYAATLYLDAPSIIQGRPGTLYIHGVSRLACAVRTHPSL